jgi:hypothetical protein
VIRTAETEHGTVQHLAEYCHIEVLNVGDRPTTIISIEATHALGTNNGQMFCAGGRFQLFGRSLPTLLSPGEMWSARIEMLDLLKLAKRGKPMPPDPRVPSSKGSSCLPSNATGANRAW